MSLTRLRSSSSADEPAEARKVLGQISSVWLVQAAVALLQLFYVAVTSRSVDEFGFGSYATAMAITGMVGILVNSGLTAASARRPTDDLAGQRALLTVAVLLGLMSGAGIFLTAAAWAEFWGQPGSSEAYAASVLPWCSGRMWESAAASCAGRTGFAPSTPRP